MRQLLKKLLVLNGYWEEAGGGGDAGNGGQPGGSGAAIPANELAGAAGTGGEAPGSEATGGGGGETSGEGGSSGGTGGEATGVTGESTPDKIDDPVAKRYSDITKQLRESQKSDRRSREQLDAALKALERVTGGMKPADPTAPVTKPVEDPEPTPPEFTDPEQYQRDMAVYTQQLAERSAKRALAAAEADRTRARIEAENEATKQAHAATWATRRTAAMEKYPDYVEVAESPKVPISAAAALTITSLEHGGEVAYYLGQHLEEAQRIFKLPPVLQAVELGKLELKVTTPKPPAVSKAADPIKPLTGSGSPQARSDDELSMEEYAAKRNAKK